MPNRIRQMTNAWPQPNVEVRVSESAECILALACFLGEDQRRQSWEAGPEWFDHVQTVGSPTLRLALGPFRSWRGALQLCYTLIGTASHGPDAMPELLTWLGDMPSEQLWLELLGLYTLHDPPDALREAMLAAGRGNVGLILEQLSRPDRQTWRFPTAQITRELVELMGGDDRRAKARLLTLLDLWYAEVFKAEWPVIAPVLERDAEALRQRARHQTAASLYEQATLGGEYVQEIGIDDLLLLPTYVGRPCWVSQARNRRRLVVHYPISDESLSPSADAARALRIMRISRALGEESRLRTLRRLTETPSTLQELADHFGLSKSTMHHHLASLRAAGLLRLRMADKRYAVRTQALTELPELLSHHLNMAPPTAGRRLR